MELTHSFVDLLQHFAPVFTRPTHLTFVAVVTGWVLSHRRRGITDVIFSSGNIGNGHWCRFHRFFSHASWDLDTLSLHLAKLLITIVAPRTTLSWAVDDTLCRKRGLTPRRRHALRSPHLQPLQSAWSVGDTIGLSSSDCRQALLGSHQSLRIACGYAAVS